MSLMGFAQVQHNCNRLHNLFHCIAAVLHLCEPHLQAPMKCVPTYRERMQNAIPFNPNLAAKLRV